MRSVLGMRIRIWIQEHGIDQNFEINLVYCLSKCLSYLRRYAFWPTTYFKYIFHVKIQLFYSKVWPGSESGCADPDLDPDNTKRLNWKFLLLCDSAATRLSCNLSTSCASCLDLGNASIWVSEIIFLNVSIIKLHYRKLQFTSSASALVVSKSRGSTFHVKKGKFSKKFTKIYPRVWGNDYWLLSLLRKHFLSQAAKLISFWYSIFFRFSMFLRFARFLILCTVTFAFWNCYEM